MYQINRTNHIVDEVKMTDNGRELIVKVDLNVEKIMGRYNAARREIAAAQQNVTDIRNSDRAAELLPQATAQLGSAIVALFVLIFGEEQTESIAEFYQGDHLGMLGDFIPYLTEVVMPKIQQAQEQLASKYTGWAAGH